MIIAIGIYSLIYWIITKNIWGIGGIFNSSWATYALVFSSIRVITYRRGATKVDSGLIALTSTLSFIWLYEIIYHYSFWVYWNYSKPPYIFEDGNYYFLLVFTPIVLCIFTGYRYISLNPIALISLVFFLSTWLIWVMIGFPQVSFPGNLYPFGSIYISVSNPDDWSYPLNALTKYFLGLFYLFIYLPRKRSD